MQAATKDIEINKKPPGCNYPSLKFPFNFEKHTGMFRLKRFAGVTGNLITPEECFENPSIQPGLVEGDNRIIASIDFKGAGNIDIEEDEAFKMAAAMNPAKKPPSKRPGKRVRTEDGPSGAPPPAPNATV